MNENTINIPEEVMQEPENAGMKLTPEYIFERIEQIAMDTGYLYEAINKVAASSAEELSIGLSQMIDAREKTNRDLIEFYQQAYEKLVTPPDLTQVPNLAKYDYKRDMAKHMIEEIKNAEDNNTKEALSSALRDLFVGW